MQKNIVTHHAEGVPHAVKLQIPKNTKNTEKLYKLLKNNETLNLIIAHHAEDVPHLAVKDLGGWPHRFHAHWTLELPAHRGEALPHLVKVVLREDNCFLLLGSESEGRKSSLNCM